MILMGGSGICLSRGGTEFFLPGRSWAISCGQDEAKLDISEYVRFSRRKKIPQF